MKPSESKYFSAARLMDEALLELLEKKDFAFLSVKEICQKAGVSRSTFYLHYETIDDLLEEATEWLNEKFVAESKHLCVDFEKTNAKREVQHFDHY